RGKGQEARGKGKEESDGARGSTAPESSSLPLTPYPLPSDGLRPSEFWALRDVSFEVRRGECVGLIGANGAGKSTLFSILSGIYGPNEGGVEIRGRLQALIALGAGFHPLLTGRENIYINGAILGMTAAEMNQRLDRILDFAELGDFIDAPVRTYSSGMTVRLGFSVAAHLDPDILLVDEVLAVGDASFQEKCMSFSRQLIQSGKTILLVSHNMIRIQAATARCLWLGHGQLMEDAATQQVVRNYKMHMVSSWKHVESSAGQRGLAGHPAVIMSVEAQDGQGRMVNDLRPGGQQRVRIDIHCRRAIACGRLWMTFEALDRGAPLLGANMFLDGHSMSLAEGRNVVDIVFDSLPFTPGSVWRINAGLRDWACHTLLAESYATEPIEVTPGEPVCLNGIGSEPLLEQDSTLPLNLPYRWVVQEGAHLDPSGGNERAVVE
ncbi:MAG: ATP-binding cassette domain-containing protein, partial [Phycisphaerae bacterium]|nr:ATP-binding cassette domain-containing protein [Phycisphaerae bacterium]